MKKIVLSSILAAGLAACVAGCSSAPTPDPDNGVSNASYRLAVTKASSNMGGVLAKMLALKSSDQSAPQPAHSAAWWDAQTGLLSDTATLLSNTLAGSTK